MTDLTVTNIVIYEDWYDDEEMENTVRITKGIPTFVGVDATNMGEWVCCMGDVFSNGEYSDEFLEAVDTARGNELLDNEDYPGTFYAIRIIEDHSANTSPYCLYYGSDEELEDKTGYRI